MLIVIHDRSPEQFEAIAWVIILALEKELSFLRASMGDACQSQQLKIRLVWHSRAPWLSPFG